MDQSSNHLATSAELEQAAAKFGRWLETEGYSSYDPYDVWGTRYGSWARKIYYARRGVGTPLIAPILLLEVLAPSIRSAFVGKNRYATADAQLVLAFLNLHRTSDENSWLEKAVLLGDELLEYSIPGYKGHCWGYPFDWQNNKGMWRRNTPFITCTPYCFEAYLALYEATQERRYLEIAASIAEFVRSDLKDTETGRNAAAGSYSPHDNSKVINASAYRAFVLIEAAGRFHKDEFKEIGLRNLRFILDTQREDGAWLYAIDNPAEAFIDHFHTCFVLKNLVKLNRRIQSAEVRNSIRTGFNWYRRNLFDEENQPRSFAIEPRLQIARLEMYNFAEAITLGSLLKDEIPEAFELARELAAQLCRKYQLRDGHFVTRVYLGGIWHTFPFLRWPQSQLFYSLTNLLVAMEAAPLLAHVP